MTITNDNMVEEFLNDLEQTELVLELKELNHTIKHDSKYTIFHIATFLKSLSKKNNYSETIEFKNIPSKYHSLFNDEIVTIYSKKVVCSSSFQDSEVSSRIETSRKLNQDSILKDLIFEPKKVLEKVIIYHGVNKNISKNEEEEFKMEQPKFYEFLCNEKLNTLSLTSWYELCLKLIPKKYKYEGKEKLLYYEKIISEVVNSYEQEHKKTKYYYCKYSLFLFQSFDIDEIIANI